jgi:hypothetical protein
MRRWSYVAVVSLVILALGGCKSYQRNRRPRAATPAPVAVEEPPPPPPPKVEEPRPAPKPVKREDASPCGPLGKGPHFAVSGVAPSDTLNVRVAPDPASEVLGELLPNTTGVLDLGRQQKVGPSTWRKVRCGALIGWVNGRFLDPQASSDRKATAKQM